MRIRLRKSCKTIPRLAGEDMIQPMPLILPPWIAPRGDRICLGCISSMLPGREERDSFSFYTPHVRSGRNGTRHYTDQFDRTCLEYFRCHEETSDRGDLEEASTDILPRKEKSIAIRQSDDRGVPGYRKVIGRLGMVMNYQYQ